MPVAYNSKNILSFEMESGRAVENYKFIYMM